MTKSIIIISTICVVSAHMGVSSPVSLDHKSGDAYRYPVSSDSSPMNGGACHGHQTAQASYAWVWTPLYSGTCEIYQNCYEQAPVVLTMGGGVPHGGGKCKLYKCKPGKITLPKCTRKFLPETYDDCVEVASTDDCTTKGNMPGYTGGAPTSPTTAPTAVSPTTTVPTAPGMTLTPTPLIRTPTPGPPDPPTVAPASFPEGGSTSRCGKNWPTANTDCGGQACRTDSDCGGDQWCWGGLNRCQNGGIAPRPTPPPTPIGATKCVSIVPYIMDLWCEQVRCDPVYFAFCARVGTTTVAGMEVKASAQLETVTKECQLYRMEKGENIADVAMVYDVDAKLIEVYNHGLGVTQFKEGTILHIPGDCETARAQVSGSGSKDGTEASGACASGSVGAMVGVALVVCALF